MSKISDLIEQLCSDGVEYRKLEDLCAQIIVPMRDRPKVFDGAIPWCRIEDMEGHFFNGSKSGLGVSDEVIKQMNLKVFPTGTVICSCSASIGAYAINTQPLITNQTFIGLVCGEELKNTFLRYYMETQTSVLLGLASTGTIPYISRKKFEKLLVPVPPLEIQEEIVRVLDSFAELEAELERRKAQYAYYRDKLLTFTNSEIERERELLSKSVKWLTLGNIADVFDGTHTTPEYQETGIKFVSVENIRNPYASTKYVSNAAFGEFKVKPRRNDIFMTRIGDIGTCYVLDRDESLAYYVSLALIRPNNKVVLSNYLKHVIHSFVGRRELRKRTLLTAVPMKINKRDISKLLIPVPPLEEQQRIVDILDKFDALVNDISQGLPAEIEARRKQYEYYRDKLLTFKEKVN